MVRAINELRAKIDRSHFDLDALLEKLDYEPERILDFVTRSIYFEQYEGLLRGAQGTLMSRAGNSLDQAILTATLLNNAGADARIVGGKIGPSDAGKLLELMFLKRHAPAPAFATTAGGMVTTEPQSPHGQSHQLVREASDKFAAARTQALAIASELKQHLRVANLSLASVSVTAEMIRSAQEYFWVEYKLNANERWQYAHPAFHGATPASLERRSVLVGEIPEGLQHRVRIEVEIEQRMGDKLIRKSVMGPWEKPVANLVGRQFTYTNFPSGMTSIDDLDINRVAKDTVYFLPLLNGKPAPNAQTFDLNGVTAPPDIAASAAAGIFREIGSKVESAVSALGGIGKKSTADIRSLVAQTLIYTLIRPGGKEEVIRRAIYRNDSGIDQITPESIERRRLGATWKLAGVETFMVSSGDYPEAYVLDRFLGEALGLSTQLKGETQKGNSGNDETRFGPEFALFSMMAAGQPKRTDRTNFVMSPEIVGRWQRVVAGSNDVKLESSVDIVAQGRRAFERKGSDVFLAIEDNFENGVWATLAETLVPHADPDGKTAIQAADALEEARRANVAIRAITATTASLLQTIDLPQTMKQSISESLAKGHVVLIPERIEQGMHGGWWRVDPRTGEALGLGREGKGQHTLEELVFASLLTYAISPKLAGLATYTVCVTATECSSNDCIMLGLETMMYSVIIAAVFALLAVAVAYGGAYAAAGSVAAIAGTTEVSAGLANLVHAIELAGISVDFVKAGYGTAAAACKN